MRETRSLAEKSIFSQPISVVVSDIDYTLVDFDTAHNAGIAALVPQFGSVFSKQVNEIYLVINTHHQHKNPGAWTGKGEYDEILKEIAEIEKPIIADYGVKKWSRESWILLAAKKCGLHLTQKEVEVARDLYWSAHANNSSLYEDAQIFLSELEKRTIPLILMTTTDSIMMVNDDLSLSYDPDFSERYKMKRIEMLPLRYSSIIVGEVFDKPHSKFFDRVYTKISDLGSFDRSSILFVGDSPSSDLVVPENDGFATLLIKR